MNAKNWIALIGLSSVIASSSVFAQENGEAVKKNTDPTTTVEQKKGDVTEYTFDDALVDGDLLRPDSGDVTVRRPTRNKSLIKVRLSYLHELLKSIEDF